jgi:hypothetical protein
LKIKSSEIFVFWYFEIKPFLQAIIKTDSMHEIKQGFL